MAEATSRPR